MTQRINRRRFLKSTAVIGASTVGAGYFATSGSTARASVSANEEVRFACIGINGKGDSDSDDANRSGKVVAICDVDSAYLAEKSPKFPGARAFQDYRKLFDEMGDSFDAVTISTPDHMHALIAARAMRMGKHCFCQKPLTHSIEEARILGNLAREKNVVTQMGNQGTANSNLRMCAALIRNGIVGTVREVHVWTNRPVWPQSNGLKLKEAPEANEVEAWNKRAGEINWDLWIGGAAKRPYSPEIHPFKWRGLWAFGTGALGDMACHTFNMPFMALNLRDPVSVESENTPHDGVFYPERSKITFQFPELGGRGAVKVVWYDGKAMPDPELTSDLPRKKDEDAGEDDPGSPYESGCLIVGDKGKFFAPEDYAEVVRDSGLIVNGEFTNILKFRKDVEVVRSPGHFEEFVNGIRGEGTPMSNFPDYAGPLTETILLGNLAVYSGEKINWDARNMVAANANEAVQKMIRHDYQNGYSLD